MEWISVKDRLPDEIESSDILIISNIDTLMVDIDYYNEGWVNYPDKEVTHWMSLPHPPSK